MERLEDVHGKRTHPLNDMNTWVRIRPRRPDNGGADDPQLQHPPCPSRTAAARQAVLGERLGEGVGVGPPALPHGSRRQPLRPAQRRVVELVGVVGEGKGGQGLGEQGGGGCRARVHEGCGDVDEAAAGAVEGLGGQGVDAEGTADLFFLKIKCGEWNDEVMDMKWTNGMKGYVR